MNKNFGTIAALLIILLLPAAAYSQSNGGNVVVISDTSGRPLTGQNQLSDRVTLIDGSVLNGKITEMTATRVVMRVSGTDYIVDPARIANVERNINMDNLADKQRPVSVKTKDGSRFRGNMKRADANITYILSGGSEIPVRNDQIESIEYLDVDRVRQGDAIAARPPKWEITLKGGSMFVQPGTFNGLLAPGYFGLAQIEYPAFQLPLKLRVAPGLQTGYLTNAGKSDNSTKINLFPGLITVTVSYQVFDLPLDIFASGLMGVNLTRSMIAGGTERLSLDLSYGAELGAKYHINELVNVRLAGIWLAVSESTSTLNHLGAYAAVGLKF